MYHDDPFIAATGATKYMQYEERETNFSGHRCNHFHTSYRLEFFVVTHTDHWNGKKCSTNHKMLIDLKVQYGMRTERVIRKTVFWAILDPWRIVFSQKWPVKVHPWASSVFCEIFYYSNHWWWGFKVHCGIKTKQLMKKTIFRWFWTYFAPWVSNF